MNRSLLLALSVLLLCTAAQGLVCNVCKYKINTLCLAPGEPCRAEDGQYCETKKVYKGTLLLHKTHGCGKLAELCNKNERRDSPFGCVYHRTCCNTDLCNTE